MRCRPATALMSNKARLGHGAGAAVELRCRKAGSPAWLHPCRTGYRPYSRSRHKTQNSFRPAGSMYTSGKDQIAGGGAEGVKLGSWPQGAAFQGFGQVRFERRDIEIKGRFSQDLSSTPPGFGGENRAAGQSILKILEGKLFSSAPGGAVGD